MLKLKIILGLLNSLEVYIAKLESIKPTSIDDWKVDFENYWAVSHGLQIAVQHVTDISAHILAAQNLAAPSDYKEALLELGRNKIVPTDFAEKISGMAGFRNIVVHQYLGVDPQKVFDIIQNDLPDFGAFAGYIYDYLRREGHLPSEDQPAK